MVDVAYMFPGQGSQYVGMGKDLYDEIPACKDIFQKANEILRFDITKLCFEGPQEELAKTEISQPAILLTSVAALEANQTKSTDKYVPKFSLGLSLGEYTALVAAESISFEDALMLVRRRGLYMEEASRQNPGTMAAIIGLSRDEVASICSQTGAEIANLNSPGQVVISGRADTIEKAKAMAEEKGAKRVVMLDVSGAFHCSLMEPASQKLRLELEKTQIHPPKIPVVSNVTAKPQIDASEIRNNLTAQLTHSTYWEDSIRYVLLQGIEDFLEIGPGKVLTGLLRRIKGDSSSRTRA